MKKTQNIRVDGVVDFPCPVGWTVYEAVKAIRSEYVLVGGGMRRNGIGALINDKITEDGEYRFVNFLSQQGKVLLFDGVIVLLILYFFLSLQPHLLLPPSLRVTRTLCWRSCKYVDLLVHQPLEKDFTNI
jgi:hypothetical protein